MCRGLEKYGQDLVFAVLLLVLASCDQQAPVANLQKPATVPDKAVWVGGVDGGVYVLVTKAATGDKQIYNGEIFYENGEQWYRGKMKLMPDHASFTDINNKNSYSGWDGEVLYLTNNRSLRALEKTD